MVLLISDYDKLFSTTSTNGNVVINCHLVLQDVAFRFSQGGQQLILQSHQLNLEVFLLPQQVCPSHLQLRLFHLKCGCQKLHGTKNKQTNLVKDKDTQKTSFFITVRQVAE